MHTRSFLVSALLLALSTAASASPERVRIEGSEYRPFYPVEGQEVVEVDDFEIDATPVTNAQFLEFVRENPRWRRDRVIRLFADESYLGHWPGDLRVDGLEDLPVTRVSWFAARAYCAANGGRLPTESEWEFVARADETRKDATRDPAYNQRMIDFYSQPGGRTLDPVAERPPNVWGVYNMIGLVWEWVEDYNSAIVNSDSRSTDDQQTARFCGGAAATAENTREYATFMRFAFRSSLRPSFALNNLGFRCAYDVAD